MSQWRFRRRTFPFIIKEAYSRVDAIPIANIDTLLRAIINTMNEIRPVDEFDAVLATRLYYAVMCIKRFFPEWGITMRPHYINGDVSSPEQGQTPSEEESYLENRPLITDL